MDKTVVVERAMMLLENLDTGGKPCLNLEEVSSS